MNTEKRICQNCKSEFVIELEDFDFYEKIQVPPPTFCPECRMVRRFVFWNQRHLFRRTDDATQKEMFSGFPQVTDVKIYNPDFWNSDAWDSMQYGREYDFSRPFFDQFRGLLRAVPLPGKSVPLVVNSDYSDQIGNSKNCYLCFTGTDLENCAYVVQSFGTRDTFDAHESDHSELCYDDYMADECHRAFFSVNCESCADMWFSKDMVGCSNCFGCVNLRNKSYYIFNKPYTKEEYKAYLAKIDLGSRKVIDELKEKARVFWNRHPARFTLGIRNVNSTGEHIQETRNVQASYCIHGGENLKYCQFAQKPAVDSYDYTNWGGVISLMYETLTCGGQCSRLRFSWECWPSSHDIEYSAFCRSSSNLFGCVGLKKKQYCILNKQYSKEEYFALREKIIQHMDEMPYISHAHSKAQSANGNDEIIYKYGEFFPPEFSPFAYNETIAQDFFVLSEAEAKSKGFRWREPELREYQTTVNAIDLPDNIKDVKDDITKELVKCVSCGRAYRIIQMELDFYRRITLPLPRLCPDCRFKERFKFVNPPKLWHGKCQCAGKQSDMRQETGDKEYRYSNAASHFHGDAPCSNEFQTSFAPGRPEIVYCENCYKSEVA